MCEELKLIQFKLGIHPLKKWNIFECSTQLSGKYGLYVIVNIYNWKYLIGEGKISDRILTHLRGATRNLHFEQDYKKYGKDSFKLIGWIPESDIEKRKEIEYKLHKFYDSKSYNKPCVPKALILKLHSQGKTKKEIMEILGCGEKAIHNYIKLEKSSKKFASYDNSRKAWLAFYQTGGYKYNNIKRYNLGHYDTEQKACENRDYFIIKNNHLEKSILNYHHIDYKNFSPHEMINEKINKHLK